MDSRDVTPKNSEDEDAEYESKLVPVSLDDFKSLENVPNSGKASEKTRYNKPVNLVIDKVAVARESVAKSSNDGDDYISYRINLHYSNGEKEGLGGFRAYLENGRPNRFWSTEKSAGGKLKLMLEGFLELKEPMTFHQFVSNLQGMKVRVSSQDWSVLGKKGFKNLPIEFLPKE